MKNLDSLNLMCVFCGSSMGFDEKYRTVAVELGKQIAQRGMQLVYGGSSVGLMRLLADSALHNGGKVLPQLPAPGQEVAFPYPRHLYQRKLERGIARDSACSVVLDLFNRHLGTGAPSPH